MHHEFSRPVEILHPLFVTRTREKGRSMNFARVVHEIFKGGEDQDGSWPCLVYYLVRCLYPSDVYKWYSTMINNRLEIHLLPSALLFLRVSFSLLPFSLSLFSFHGASLLSNPRVRGSGWNRVLDSDPRDRSVERLVCAYNARNRGGNNPNCRE